MSKPNVTCSIPCFGRPQRTKEAIECLMKQTLPNWEAFVLGDGCPDFQNLIDSGYMEHRAEIARKKSNKLIYKNFEKNYGFWGYHLTNYSIQEATGRYFVFYANDDLIDPDHFEHYYNGIHGTGKDFVYFNNKIDGHLRQVHLANSNIGDSSIIVKTSFLKTMPPREPKFCHDWDLIQAMREKGQGMRAESNKATYNVRTYDKDH